MTINFTPTQLAVLEHAHQKMVGKIAWFPDSVKGGARAKVIGGLAARGLAEQVDGEWRLTDAAYEAIGVARPGPEVELEPTPQMSSADEAAPDSAHATAQSPIELDAELASAVEAAEATWAANAPKTPRPRENTKQATVIDMLRRAEGATIGQICEATGWQAHTVRGAFAGIFKKRLGLTVVSEKAEGGDRVYRLA